MNNIKTRADDMKPETVMEYHKLGSVQTKSQYDTEREQQQQ